MATSHYLQTSLIHPILIPFHISNSGIFTCLILLWLLQVLLSHVFLFVNVKHLDGHKSSSFESMQIGDIMQKMIDQNMIHLTDTFDEFYKGEITLAKVPLALLPNKFRFASQTTFRLQFQAKHLLFMQFLSLRLTTKFWDRWPYLSTLLKLFLLAMLHDIPADRFLEVQRSLYPKALFVNE